MEKESKNCWEFQDCVDEARKDCPAFKYDFGKECWLVAGSINKNPACPKSKKGLKCWDCGWYKELNPEE